MGAGAAPGVAGWPVLCAHFPRDDGAVLLPQVEQGRLSADSDEDTAKLAPGRGSHVSTGTGGRALLSGQSCGALLGFQRVKLQSLY